MELDALHMTRHIQVSVVKGKIVCQIFFLIKASTFNLKFKNFAILNKIWFYLFVENRYQINIDHQYHTIFFFETNRFLNVLNC